MSTKDDSKEMRSTIDYREQIYRNYSENFGGYKSGDRSLHFREYAQIYRDLPADMECSILDVGCGKCEWLDWLERKGYSSLSGVDRVASEMGRRTGSGYEVYDGDAIETLERFEGKFDLIHTKDLFEHFTKDEAVGFLLACHRALKPGGLLWIRTFNAQSPMASATRYGDFSHEIGVTPGSLAQVMSACGFRSIAVSGHIPTAGGWKGALRKVIFLLITLRSKVELRVRHGGGAKREGVDQYCVLPDLFGSGQKE